MNEDARIAPSWHRGLTPREVAALEVAYRHDAGRCNAVVHEGPGTKGQCIHLMREVIPEALAAADAVQASEVAQLRETCNELARESIGLAVINRELRTQVDELQRRAEAADAERDAALDSLAALAGSESPTNPDATREQLIEELAVIFDRPAVPVVDAEQKDAK